MTVQYATDEAVRPETNPAPPWQALVVDIGERIVAFRRRRGMSQAVLAGLVGRSESWLSQVERGVRKVDNLSVIMGLAAALHVPADSLIDKPLRNPSDLAPSAWLDPVRGYLLGYEGLISHRSQAVVGAELVLEAVNSINGLYQAAEYGQAVQLMPELLRSADGLLNVDHSARAIHSYVAAYVATAKILHKLGETRMSLVAAERASAAASVTRSIIDRALAARQVVQTLMASGEVLAAEILALRMARALECSADAASDDSVSLQGSLWLLAAVIAARRKERFEAQDRINRADKLARQLGRDANCCWTAFGPTNVAIHAVSVAAELGDAAEALRVAQAVVPSELPAGLMGRRAQLHLDLGWACTQQRRDSEATIHLLEAERIAPELMRYYPKARDSIRELAARNRTGVSVGLIQDLAVRAGVLPS